MVSYSIVDGSGDSRSLFTRGGHVIAACKIHVKSSQPYRTSPGSLIRMYWLEIPCWIIDKMDLKNIATYLYGLMHKRLTKDL